MDETTISVEIPLDDDGFLDRQCPSAICRRYFKVLSVDWNAVESGVATCPFCGLADDVQNFNTAEQHEYFQAAAIAYAHEKMQEILGGFAKRVNRSQPRNSMFSINVSTKFSRIPVPISPDALDSMRLQIQCEKCNCTYAVVGAGFFCPLCGKNSARHTFRQAIAKARNAVAVAQEVGTRVADPDSAAETRRDSLENQVNNLVTAFQRFGEAAYVELPRYSTPPARSLFQRLSDSSIKWSEAGGRPFQDVVDADEWKELLVFFQQRHVLSHQDGFVDAEYVGKSGDTNYRVGQRLVINEAQVLRMAALIEKLGVAMLADLQEVGSDRDQAPVATERPLFPPKLPGLTDDDWHVFRFVCESAVEEDRDFLEGASIWTAAQAQGFTEEQFGDSVDMLESRSLIKANMVMDSRHIPIGITVVHRGLDTFFSHTLTNNHAARQQVAQELLDDITSSTEMVERTGLTKLFVHHTLKDFERRGWVGKIFWTSGEGIAMPKTPVYLKRFVQS